MKTGIELIAEERKEQIEKHGRTIKLDVFHNGNKELTRAACALISPLLDGEQQGNKRLDAMPERWKPDRTTVKMINHDYKERLVIAGALIAAEIDRIQAIESKKGGEG